LSLPIFRGCVGMFVVSCQWVEGGTDELENLAQLVRAIARVDPGVLEKAALDDGLFLHGFFPDVDKICQVHAVRIGREGGKGQELGHA
jgi:hypothetical protein